MAHQRCLLAAFVALLPAVEALAKLSRMSCDVAVYPSIFEATPAIRVITSSSENDILIQLSEFDQSERRVTERAVRRGFAREESSSSFSSLEHDSQRPNSRMISRPRSSPPHSGGEAPQLQEGEQPLHRTALRSSRRLRTPPSDSDIQGFLAHKKQPPPLGQPYGPRHRPTAGS